jgi:hypothetical protein
MSFGKTLRAARMRFHWSHTHGAYIRMRQDGKIVIIELQPHGLLPTKLDREKHEYILWWTKRAVLDYVPALRSIRSVKKAITFNVDAETGERV